VHFFFALDTLEYLHKGGRISGARWLLGTALSIKPVLHFVDGILEPLVQVRTKRKALDKIVALVGDRVGGKRIAEIAVVDVDVPEEGDDIAARLGQRFGISTVYRTTVSPAIGTHAGPGTVGVAFYTED
jgi:DegV family protein with EDD domain